MNACNLSFTLHPPPHSLLSCTSPMVIFLSQQMSYPVTQSYILIKSNKCSTNMKEYLHKHNLWCLQVSLLWILLTQDSTSHHQEHTPEFIKCSTLSLTSWYDSQQPCHLILKQPGTKEVQTSELRRKREQGVFLLLPRHFPQVTRIIICPLNVILICNLSTHFLHLA